MLGARIAALLKEHGWILNLVFIALGSYFVAGAANSVVARAIRVIPSVEDMPALANHNNAISVQKLTFTSMAERNLMAVKRENLHEVQTPTTPQEPTMVSGRDFNEADLKPCTIAATLRATLVADSQPEWSMAVIVNNNTHEPGVFSINEGSNLISDDAALVAIRSREIVVRRRDHFERCTGEGEGALVSTQPIPPAPPPHPEEGDGGPGVTKVSESQYNIERGEVDKALSNLNEVATQARIVPSFKNGKANGFKMFSIKPGSIYQKIGLQNGDVIQKINGYDINSPDKALEIYQKLKDATSIAIELQRRGQTMNMGYNIN